MNEVIKAQMKVNVNLRMNPKTEIVLKDLKIDLTFKNSQNWQMVYPRWLLIEYEIFREIFVQDFPTSRTLARTKPVQVYINS